MVTEKQGYRETVLQKNRVTEKQDYSKTTFELLSSLVHNYVHYTLHTTHYTLLREFQNKYTLHREVPK